MSLYHFMIISLTDTPLYELEWTPLRQATNTAANPQDTNTSSRHLAQFVIHAALDTLEEAVWENGNLQLKEVDKFNEMKVWGYVTPSNIRLLLLHTSRNDDGIKNFFSDVHELYIKILMNPFYQAATPIKSATFDMKVRMLARKYLN